jgi:hypothetical protein
MGKLKYLSGGQNNWNKTLFWNGPKYIGFFHALPAIFLGGKVGKKVKN